MELLETRYAATNKKLDVSSMMQYFALDSFTNLQCGKSWDCLDREADETGIIRNIKSVAHKMSILAELPELAILLLKPLFHWLRPSEKDAKGVGKILG